jgi:hypothetical protein
MAVEDMAVDNMSVNEMTVDEMSVDKMACCLKGEEMNEGRLQLGRSEMKILE